MTRRPKRTPLIGRSLLASKRRDTPSPPLANDSRAIHADLLRHHIVISRAQQSQLGWRPLVTRTLDFLLQAADCRNCSKNLLTARAVTAILPGKVRS